MAVTGEMKLGRQPSTTPAEPFVVRMLDPFLCRPDWVDDALRSHAGGRGPSNYQY